MNILGVDYGEKRVGIAWVQEGLDVVLPYGVIESTNDEEKKSKLSELVKEEGINKIILGLPKPLEGGQSDHVDHIRRFGEELEGMAGVSVEFIDEKFTSKQADHMGGDASRDEKAAMIMLQSYIHSK